MIRLYHGTETRSQVESVIRDIAITARGFHTTEDINVAKQYGSHIVEFTMDSMPECDTSTIDKTGDVSEDIKSGIEHVFRTMKHKTSFYNNLDDIKVIGG